VGDVEAFAELIRSRRTHKSFGPEPVPKETLDELLELARWAPNLVLASCVLTGDLQQDEEDLLATACAVYTVLLAAHARGLAGYWRTPRVLRTRAGRDAVGLPDGERFVGLIHLGRALSAPPPPERAPLESYRGYLP
jgi:nitroreductase